MTKTPPFTPVDGRITSLQVLQTNLTGGEVMEIVSPGNAASGNNYQVSTATLAAYFATGGLDFFANEPITVDLTSGVTYGFDYSYPGTFTGAQAFNAGASSSAYALTSGGINPQVTTSYPLAVSDNGKIVTLNNAGTITLTVPTGLGASFSCQLVQLGAGQVVVTPSATTVNSFNGKVKLAGPFASAVLIAYATDTFVLIGNLS